MVITIALLSIALLVLFISVIKIHPFISFLIVSIAAGCALKLTPAKLFHSLQEGMGSTLGSIIGLLALGAMLGKILSESGAIETITQWMTGLFGPKKLRFAFMVTGFIVGLPLFYSVAFLLLAPLVITAAVRTNKSAVYIGIPLLASLSVTQGFLPPHPAPAYLVQQLHADIGVTLFYGIIIAIPAILISGLLYGSTLKKYIAKPNENFVSTAAAASLPGKITSLFCIALPILLIATGTIAAPYIDASNPLHNVVLFFRDPVASLLIAVIVAAYLLEIKRGKRIKEISNSLAISIKDIAALFLVFAGAGGLKQVLIDGGLSESLNGILQQPSVNPLLIGWGIAALIRVSVGSSTVSGITTAGLIMPVMHGVDPNLMALSIGAGSMTFSHVNDTGFWLFREYFQLSMIDTFKTWTVMETLVSITGLLGVLVLDYLL